MGHQRALLAALLLIIGSLIKGQIISQSVTRILPQYVTPYSGLLLSFMQLVRQKTNGNQVQQCPCVHLPGSDKCITYDSRYVAVSLEEAILTFVDQTMDPRIYEQRTGGPITPATFLCSSSECRQCVGMLAARLRQIGLLRRQLTFTFPIPAENQINPSGCPRIRLSRGVNTIPPSQTVTWANLAINAASALRNQFSQRPKSIFASLVEQAIRESRSAGGRPQITNILQSVGTTRSATLPASERENQNSNIRQGNINIVGNQVRGNQNGGQFNGGIISGQNRGSQNFQAGFSSNGRLIGESRPRNFQRPQIFQQSFSPNPSQFQQIIGNQGQQFIQPQQNQQFFTSQQQGFGIQPQAIANTFNQISQFIPNSATSGIANSWDGSNNGGLALGIGNNRGLGFGFGNNPGGNPISGGGAGGGSSNEGSREHGIGGSIGGFFGRKKRQAQSESVIGERFVISCVEKGDAETEGTDFLNLCTICWTWRQLPDNYFPRILNELVCQEDDYCLSGWGTCSQRYRNVDILQKQGNDWIPTSISTATCCDCKVKAGSDAHALVVGGKK